MDLVIPPGLHAGDKEEELCTKSILVDVTIVNPSARRSIDKSIQSQDPPSKVELQVRQTTMRELSTRLDLPSFLLPFQRMVVLVKAPIDLS